MTTFRNHCLILFLVFIGLQTAGPSINAQEKKDPSPKFKTFDKNGLTFQYPDHWKIGSDEAYAGTRLVIVHGSNNAIVTIQFSETEVADSIEEYAKEYSKTASEEVKKVAKLVDESLSKKSVDKHGFEVMDEKFSIQIGETKLPHDRKYLRKKMGKYACFIVCQSSTPNLPKVLKGFQQLLSSIKLEKTPDLAS